MAKLKKSYEASGQWPGTFSPHWGLHLYVVKIKIPLVSYFHGHKQSRNDSKYLTCWILELLALTLIFILGTCAICVGHLTMKRVASLFKYHFQKWRKCWTWAFRMTCSLSHISMSCNTQFVHHTVSEDKKSWNIWYQEPWLKLKGKGQRFKGLKPLGTNNLE